VIDRPEAVLIAGPTASGKSALALTLAGALDGVIVNADSAQVYVELAILTARPSADDEARAEHRLYGYRQASMPFSVADWLADMADVLAALRSAGRTAIIVGGTGLYFRALTQGLADVPDIPPEIRAHWRAEALANGAERLHLELARRDPHMAERLRPSDAQRIARALEVIEATGRSLALWQADAPRPPLLQPGTTRRFTVEIDRALLHARIDARFEQMVASGALAEARSVASLGLDPSLPAMRAIGVRPLIAAIRGELDLAEAIARGQAESRQYAKRQVTWLRHQMADWQRITPDLDVLSLVREWV
jgi:tRNA dimethylallyltransferase